MVMTIEESAELAELRAFKADAKRKRSYAISPKGCVTLRGLRRFGIAFYPNEWKAIADELPAILEFIENHKDELEKVAAASKADSAK